MLLPASQRYKAIPSPPLPTRVALIPILYHPFPKFSMDGLVQPETTEPEYVPDDRSKIIVGGVGKELPVSLLIWTLVLPAALTK